jgi:hypothetical protein
LFCGTPVSRVSALAGPTIEGRREFPGHDR